MADILDNIYNQFASFTSSLGYSEIHGKIISALIIEGASMSLEELSKKAKYSLSAISISLDLLEVIGIVKKFRNAGDRKIYVRLDGDLLKGMRNAVLIKLQKEIFTAMEEIKQYKNIKDKSIESVVIIMKKELKRFDSYVKELSKVPIPMK